MENYNRYETTLSDEEIIKISEIIRDFEDDTLSYMEVQNLFSKLNISMVPVIVDSSTFKTIRQVSDLRLRVQTKTLKAKDIDCYLLSSERYNNVLYRYDRRAIEKLAEHGDKHAIKTLEALKDWESDFPNWTIRRKEEFKNIKEKFDKNKKYKPITEVTVDENKSKASTIAALKKLRSGLKKEPIVDASMIATLNERIGDLESSERARKK